MNTPARVRVVGLAAAVIAAATMVRGYYIPNPDRTWADGEIEIHEQLTGPAGPLIDGSANLNAAFETAVDTWNRYLGRVQFVPRRGSTSPIGDGNDVNNVIISATAFERAFDDTTLATTVRWFDTRTNRRIESDIIFNARWNWNSYRGAWRADAKDIVRVALHQLGLGIGLGQPDADGQMVPAIMNGTVGDLDTLAFDDIAGAAALYGSPGSPSGDLQQARAATDADGVATFRVGERSVPVRFVDPETGSAIPGADAFLFSDGSGAAFTAIVDPLGRYHTRMTPMRLPVRPSAAGALAARPIEVPVPPARSGPEPTSTMMNLIASNPTLRSLWWDLERTATNALNDIRAMRIVVERDVRLDEINEASLTSYVDAAIDKATDVTVTGVIKGMGTPEVIAGYELYGKWSDRAAVVPAVNQMIWDVTRLWQYGQGYRNDQKYRLTVARLPVNVPEPLRSFTEIQIHVRPLEEPRDPWFPKGPGVISGRLVEVRDGRSSPTSGTVTLENDHQFSASVPASGFFTIPELAPGWQKVWATKEGYRPASQHVFVEGDGRVQNLTLALVRRGISRIDIVGTASRLREGQVSSYRATAIGMDGQPYTPAPIIFFQSESPGVATIDLRTGGVRAVRVGSTRITAQAPDFGVTSAPATLVVERGTPCPYTLSNTRFTATDAGGSANVTVTTDSDCDWTAVPSPTSMMSVVSGGRGPGTGTFRLSVSRNTAPESRTGTITISGMPAPNTVTVTQSGTSTTCAVTLSRTSLSLGASATSSAVTVTPAGNCAWTASVTSGSFLTVSPTSGSATTTVTITATANTGAQRTGSVRIGDQTVSVTQAAGSTGTATTMTGSIQCTRGTQGGEIFNNLVCTGTVTVTTGTGFESGTQYLGLLSPNGLSLRTSSFTAGATGGRFTLTVTGRGVAVAPDRPPCPATQTLVGFYRVNEITGTALVSAPVSIPVSCN